MCFNDKIPFIRFCICFEWPILFLWLFLLFCSHEIVKWCNVFSVNRWVVLTHYGCAVLQDFQLRVELSSVVIIFLTMSCIVYTLDFWTCLCPLLVALTDLVNLLTTKLLIEEHRSQELTQWIVQWGQECLTLFLQLDCRILVTHELLLPEWLLPVPCPITLANLIVVVRCHILLCTCIPIGKVMTCIIRNTQIQFCLRSSIESLQTMEAQTLYLCGSCF